MGELRLVEAFERTVFNPCVFNAFKKYDFCSSFSTTDFTRHFIQIEKKLS